MIDVAIGLIRDEQERYCVSQRHADAHLGALWEFPGGKCMPNEPMLVTLQRELHEELGIVVRQAQKVMMVPYDYSDRSVRLHVYTVKVYEGEPRSMEGRPVLFVSVPQLLQLAMPAANHAIIMQCLMRA